LDEGKVTHPKPIAVTLTEDTEGSGGEKKADECGGKT